MKKLSFIVTVVFFLFSCGEKEFYPVLITNDSSKTVSYTYNDVDDTLPASETKDYEVKAYTPPPNNITDENGIASLVIYTHNLTGDYTFYDADPLDLHVTNKSPVEITIKADNFIDNDGLTELTIDPNPNEANTDAKIYTKTPKFTSTTDYPMVVEWTIVENVMSVTIR